MQPKQSLSSSWNWNRSCRLGSSSSVRKTTFYTRVCACVCVCFVVWQLRDASRGARNPPQVGTPTCNDMKVRWKVEAENLLSLPRLDSFNLDLTGTQRWVTVRCDTVQSSLWRSAPDRPNLGHDRNCGWRFKSPIHLVTEDFCHYIETYIWLMFVPMNDEKLCFLFI